MPHNRQKGSYCDKIYDSTSGCLICRIVMHDEFVFFICAVMVDIPGAPYSAVGDVMTVNILNTNVSESSSCKDIGMAKNMCTSSKALSTSRGDYT